MINNTNIKKKEKKKKKTKKKASLTLSKIKKEVGKKKKSLDTEIAIAFYTWHHCTRKGAKCLVKLPTMQYTH